VKGVEQTVNSNGISYTKL